MWTCEHCGCLSIAAPLEVCPHCFKERDMATCTTGGASNARALPGETGYVEPESDEAQETPAEAAADIEVARPAKPVQAVSEPPKPAKPEPKPAPAKPSEPAKGA